MPERIQRRRTKGWRMPAGAIYVGRPSRWGNPFTISSAIESGYASTTDEARFLVVTAFASCIERGDQSTWWFDNGASHLNRIRDNLHELRGHDLCCWCPLDSPCHATVLLELANRGDS